MLDINLLVASTPQCSGGLCIGTKLVYREGTVIRDHSSQLVTLTLSNH